MVCSSGIEPATSGLTLEGRARLSNTIDRYHTESERLVATCRRHPRDAPRPLESQRMPLLDRRVGPSANWTVQPCSSFHGCTIAPCACCSGSEPFLTHILQGSERS